MELTPRHFWRTSLRIITPPAIARYAAAERALAENAIAEYEAGIYTETPGYLAANDESAAAAAAVPWWLEWLTPLIDRKITRELDYFRRTGQP